MKVYFQMSDVENQNKIKTEASIDSDLLLKTSTVALGAMALSACGGAPLDFEEDDDVITNDGTANGLYPDTSQVTEDPYSVPSSEQQAARFLQKAGFSSNPDEISHMMSMTYAEWLDDQFNKDIGQTLWDWRASARDDSVHYLYSSRGDYDGSWRDMLEGEDVLRKRMTLALLQILVVGNNGLWIAHDGWSKCDYWDVLNKHSFGNYFDLLLEVSRHPLMMTYLTSFNSRAEEEGSGHRPDENYAREVMQLFSIGLVELNIDGTPKLDDDGNEIPTYDQETVVQLARVFTGYGWHGYRDDFYPHRAQDPVIIRTTDGVDWHDRQDKTFLGETIPAGTEQEETLRRAIEIIFNHPNVGPFLSKLLIQRFVTSNPSPGYVERVATVFNANENNERGNLRSVLSAILLDEEALAVPDESFNFMGKVREPMLRLVQWYRTFGGKSVSGEWDVGYLGSYSHGIGQLPFFSPSVFNHYYPDFAPRDDAFGDDFVAPELQILDEVSIAGYTSYIWNILQNNGVRNSANTASELVCDYANETALLSNAESYVEHLNLHLCAGRLSAETVTDIASAVDDRNYTDTTGLTGNDLAGAERVNNERRNIGISLVMSCPEYLVQV